MNNIIEITDFQATELDVYARLTEAQLLNREFPEKGLFIAESPKVIKRALDAGYEAVSCTDIASTGCILTTTVNGVTSTVSIVVYGDVDGDGATTATDYLGISGHIKNRARLTGAYGVAADVSGDDAISTVDLITMALSLKN